MVDKTRPLEQSMNQGAVYGLIDAEPFGRKSAQ